MTKNRITLNLTSQDVEMLSIALGLANSELHKMLDKAYKQGKVREVIEKNIYEIDTIHKKILHDIAMNKGGDY